MGAPVTGKGSALTIAFQIKQQIEAAGAEESLQPPPPAQRELLGREVCRCVSGLDKQGLEQSCLLCFLLNFPVYITSTD